MINRIIISLALALILIVAIALPVAASDHLFNAAHSEGVDERGFTNPVTLNPSGVSGPNAAPLTVPGEGNPNAGADQGTPSVDLSVVSVRSGGNGEPQKP